MSEEVEVTGDVSVDDMLKELDEETRLKVLKYVEEAPAFKPAKALKASVKSRFKAGSAAVASMQGEIDKYRDDPDYSYLAGVGAKMIELVEGLLEMLVVNPNAYDQWSSSLDFDVAEVVLMVVYSEQAQLLAKSEPSAQS